MINAGIIVSDGSTVVLSGVAVGPNATVIVDGDQEDSDSE
ncbi:hypothetical protein Psi01_58900 [Planobispora siamensis]|uniref:Uncharacterized protein n=1 Tax=Planobispora siamensis TaxID=936338 RepID=A0A8J3SMQ7_9ACTN|nr:hypothetical protein Psi01_58900 [Planobispora siamensis]